MRPITFGCLSPICGRNPKTIRLAPAISSLNRSSSIACSPSEDLTFTQAVFEAVSGWTTTGLSVVDVTTTAKHVTLLWRSTMQLIGGAGFAITMLMALAGPVGIGLPPAEGRGEQLLPHVHESARLVFLIYSAYVVVGIGA